MGDWLGRAWQGSVVHLLFGFWAMGSWATIADLHRPIADGLIAGAVQGTLTTSFTPFLKTAIEAISKRLDGLAEFCMPPLATFAASSIIQSAVHLAAGTPEVVASVAVSVWVATIHSALYSNIFWRKKEGTYERQE